MKRAAPVGVVLFACLAVPKPSSASIVAKPAAPLQSLASGKWGAVPSTTSLTFGTSNTTRVFFTVSNAGTLALVGSSYTISVANTKPATSLSLLACTGGTWNQSTGACTGGTQVTIVTSTGSATTASTTTSGCFPAATGSSITLQALISKSPNNNTVGTVSLANTRSQVRAATTSNS